MHCLDNTYMSYEARVFTLDDGSFLAPQIMHFCIYKLLVADASSGFMRQLYPGLSSKPSAPALYIPPRLALNMYR